MSDPPKLYRDTEYKARKAHRCCECRGTISRGENYFRFEGLWDDWGTYKTCARCHPLMAYFSKRCGYDDLPAFGELYDYVVESRHSCPEMVFYFVKTRELNASPENGWEWLHAHATKLRQEYVIHEDYCPQQVEHTLEMIVHWLLRSQQVLQAAVVPPDPAGCLKVVESLRAELKTGRAHPHHP